MTQPIRLALPSKGAIAKPTLDFLKRCGLSVYKPNERQYTGTVSELPGVEVLFQRVKDVAYKVADGTVQFGITGLDVVHEFPHEDLIVVHPALGYGHCQLVVAVPQSWIDVEHMADLVDVAQDFRELHHRNIRIATTYTHSARQYLHAQGIHHFTLVKSEGAIEAAPTIGYADAVVDLTQTGTTLRENHLRPLGDGVIIDSQACLVANRRALQQQPAALDALSVMLEYIDAALQARSYHQLTVNIQGENAESLAARVMENPVTRGLQGPTIAPIVGSDTSHLWFTVTLILQRQNLLTAVQHLRSIGAAQISTSPVEYVFMEQSPTYARLLETLHLP